MTPITKAVFPVAGLGTRFLPATKAIPKEMMPIVDTPLIQYAAEEAIAAGIDTLVFVTGRNKRAIEDHFDRNRELEDALLAKNKLEQADMVRNIVPQGVECIFVRQPEQLGLGHAVLCAERAVGNVPFAVLLADDFLYGNAARTTKNLTDAFHTSGKTQLSVMEVSGAEISQYGVVVPDSHGGIAGLVEKPNLSNAPSNLASIGRYVLRPDIFGILRDLPVGAGGEIQLADALDIQAQNGLVEAVALQGRRFDCGSVQGFLDATRYVAERRQRYS